MPSPITRRVSQRTGRTTWTVQIQAGTRPNGKPRWVTKSFDKERDARQFLNQELHRRDRGELVEPSRVHLGEYLDRWLESVVRMRVRPSTHESYRWLLEAYARPALGTRPLASVSSIDLQELYGMLSSQGKSARTIRYLNAVLKSAFRQARKWRMIVADPTEDVELPRQQRPELTVLTQEQAGRFLDAITGARFEALFKLALATGMRPSEYLALRWADFDVAKAQVSVRRSVQPLRGGGWQFHEPKTRSSRRTVPIPSEVVNALRTHRARQAEERLRAGPAWTRSDLIFTTPIGTPVDRSNLLKQHFQPALRKAGLPSSVRLYDLRHSCATLLLAAGVHPKVASERLGHSSVIMTLDTYSHVLPDMQREATAKLGEILFGSVDGEPDSHQKRRQPAPLQTPRS